MNYIVHFLFREWLATEVDPSLAEESQELVPIVAFDTASVAIVECMHLDVMLEVTRKHFRHQEAVGEVSARSTRSPPAQPSRPVHCVMRACNSTHLLTFFTAYDNCRL